MKRLASVLAVVSALLLTTTALGQNRYGWTISNSSVDPLANSGAPTFGIRTLYLWFNCNTNDGMASAEFDIDSVGITHLATNAVNGFLNAGGAENLLLAVGGCPGGPAVACNLVVLDTGGTMCLAPSLANGVQGTVDCQPLPAVWPIDGTGYNSGAVACGSAGQCPPDAVQGTSWGTLKSLYR